MAVGHANGRISLVSFAEPDDDEDDEDEVGSLKNETSKNATDSSEIKSKFRSGQRCQDFEET